VLIGGGKSTSHVILGAENGSTSVFEVKRKGFGDPTSLKNNHSGSIVDMSCDDRESSKWCSADSGQILLWNGLQVMDAR
jgi:hypothetical protein